MDYETNHHQTSRHLSTSTQSAEAIKREWLQLQKAQKDPRHFGPIYERYFRDIYLFVFKRVSEQESTQDITQQVFIKAMNYLPRYKFQGLPFSSFLFRVATNEVNLHFRSANSQRSISLDDNVLITLKNEDQECDGFEWKMESLLDCLNELSEAEVELLELRFFEERPFKEVAYILNITENNAKVRSYRLLEKMRKIIHG